MAKNTIKIKCVNTGETHEVEMGLTLAEIAKKLDIKLKYSIIGAQVNNKNIGLSYKVFQPKMIKFFDIMHPEGLRTYVRSLTVMLLAAAEEVVPDAKVSITHSVSRGLYFELRRNGQCLATLDDIDAIKNRMKEMVNAALPITREEMETSEAIKLFDHIPDMQKILMQHGDIYTTVHHLNGHSAAMLGDMVPNTSIIDVWDLIPYFDGMLLRLPDSVNPEHLGDMIKQDKMFGVFQEFDSWLNMMNVRHLCDLNEAIANGQGAKIIQIAEALHEKKIGRIADMIAERRDKVKVVLISGPSSSGKTTFSKRLGLQMIVNGIRPVTLSIDNYFVNRDQTPRDENGEYDFEAVEAIDTELFNKQIMALANGEEVEIPKFSFQKGERYYDGEKLKMEEGDMLVIEGTHGLTPQLTAQIPNDVKFLIYAAPLSGINFDSTKRIQTTDNRLIRRIVRDYQTRGYSARDTIARWPSVRRGEDKYIYPNQEGADVMFNSNLLYELSVLKTMAEPMLLEVAPNTPEFAEARRLLKFLSYFKPLSADDIPPTSLLREFVGGSSFNYD
ncbi:MAG: nucleoside kinase [Bacteroidales bacterium]|nr:nucleoside kinase [Bacteroidales bacterium]